MAMQNLRILCNVLKADLVYESDEGTLTPFFDSLSDSPMMISSQLRERIRKGT